MKIITRHQQNKLHRLYPFQFDYVPEDVKAPLLFGTGNYTIEEQVKLEDQLGLQGQKVVKAHPKGIEFDRVTVLSSYFTQRRWKKHRTRCNFEARLKAGTVEPARLGIVGNNLDKSHTPDCEKKARRGLFLAQNMIQKIRLDGKPIVSKTVCNCGKPLGLMVEIQNSKEHNSSSINGVQTCQSVWACPVCRNRIISRRAEELKRIYDIWNCEGGRVFMVTLTTPHKKGDNLAELYGSNATKTGLAGALNRFRTSRVFSKNFKGETGYLGDIRGIEVTWGWKNGFHPHIHMLLFVKNDIDRDYWKKEFHRVWARACVQSGLQKPSFERGVVVSKCNTSEQAQYLAKWSAATELISQNMKIAREGNFSISELERCLYDSEYRATRQMSMTKAACILRAYYGAMKGQKMLQTGGIGPGGNWKKELLEIPEEEENGPETHRHVCFIDYRVYIKIKRAGKLPALLEASERGGGPGAREANVRAWLERNGFDPWGIMKPHGPAPPPTCFSYLTGNDYA